MNALTDPTLLLLLLQTIFLSSNLVNGRIHGYSCEKNVDCEDTKWCNLDTKLCDCWEHSHPSVSTIQVYHSLKRSCLSAVGSLCYIVQRSGRYPLNCAPNSECKRTDRVLNLPSDFGVCECIPGYAKDYSRLCEKVEERQVDLELGDIFSSGFSGRVGVTQDSQEEKSKMPPRAEKVKDDQSDDNRNLWISESKRNNLMKPDASVGHVNRVGFGVVIMVGVMLAQI